MADQRLTEAPAFRRIMAPRASEMAARQVADLVLRRRLAEGDRLPSEVDLAGQMGISRGSVREALRLLESWGLVRVERGRGRGATVRHPGVGDMARGVAMVLDSRGSTLAELTQARIAIECACIRLAAERNDQAALQALLASVDEVQTGAGAWQEHTVAFHTALATATGNVALETIVASLGGIIRYSAALTVVSPESQAATLRSHRRIAEALVVGNAARAERRLTRHMNAFIALVQTRYALDVGSLTSQLGANNELDALPGGLGRSRS